MKHKSPLTVIYNEFIGHEAITVDRAGFAHEIGRNVIFLPVPWLVSAAVV